MPEKLDDNLLELFGAHDRQLHDEPFVSSTVKLIETERSRRALARRLLRIAALVCIALASPLLMEAALLLSNTLDYLFDLMARLLSTPVGTALAVAASIPLAVWNRKRIF